MTTYNYLKIIITLITSIAFVISLLFNLHYFFKSQHYYQYQPESIQNKCAYWTVYNPILKAWRWRSENLNEYFPSKDLSIDNCIIMLR